MKKLFLFIMVCLVSTSLWAQQSPLDQFFNKYGRDTSFTIINILPKMFNLFSKVNLNTGEKDSQQILDVAEKLTGLRIITKHGFSCRISSPKDYEVAEG